MTLRKHLARFVALTAVAVACCASSLALVQDASAETPGEGRRAPGSPVITLTPWENILFGRWLAIDDTVARFTRRYKLPTMWTMQTFASESVMNPVSQGSQPDDRGIGQVGYLAERYGRARGTNPKNRDYTPALRKNGSIWDPKTNVILASIWYRWVYSQPYVRSHEQAYAVSTFGPDAILGDGTIRWDAQQRVDRAKSWYPALSEFARARNATRSMSWNQLKRAVPDRMTRDLLYLNSHRREGAPMYLAMADRYLKEVRSTKSPWVTVMFGEEALLYLDQLRRAYGRNMGPRYDQLVTRLYAKRGLFGSDDLSAKYWSLLATARDRASRY